MLFRWFSDAFPMVFLWFSMVFLYFSMVFYFFKKMFFYVFSDAFPMLSSSKGGPPTALQIPARDDARSALLAARHQRLQRRTQSGASDATQKVVRS